MSETFKKSAQHMNVAEEELKRSVQRLVNDNFNRGIQIGVTTLAKLILERLNDRSKSLPDRIENAKRACTTQLKEVRPETDIQRITNILRMNADKMREDKL